MPTVNSSIAFREPRRPRVAVVGAGALGSELCQQIALNDTFAVTLIDPDMIEPRNLFHSEMLTLGHSLNGNGEANAYKGNLVLAAAKHFFSQRDWEFLPVEIADVNLSALLACDFVYSCTDNTLARCETGYVSRILGKCMIDGGVMRDGAQAGRVACYPSHANAACYLCQISDDRRADILRFAASSSLGCMRLPPRSHMDASQSLVKYVAQAMLGTGVDVMEGRSMSEAMAMTYRATGGNACELLKIARSPSCPWHASDIILRSLDVRTSIRCTLQSLSGTAPDGEEMVLELHWPICLEARCTHCSAAMRPLQRLGWVRRHGACTACGCVGALEPTDTVQTVAAAHPVAALSPRQLGFEEGDLFRIRARYAAPTASA